MKPAKQEPITERELQQDFDRVRREVDEQIRNYEVQFPDLAQQTPDEDGVVRQPVYVHQIHAAS